MRKIRFAFPLRLSVLLGLITTLFAGCCPKNCPPPKSPQKPAELTLEQRIKQAIPVDLNGAPVRGPAGAPITIVEFMDFQCPFCQRADATMKQLMKDYAGKIRWAVRQLPLSFHQNARSAAKASLAAHEQGKFWEMHDALLENQRDLSDLNIRKIAKGIGLNMASFEKAWKSDKFEAQIAEDIRFSGQHGATGTPSFFINGVLVTGARPIGSFQEVIDRLLKGK